jgi:hypothetical protein
MGYSRFPTEGVARQLKDAHECCYDEGNLKKWDCACSWGCPLCWIAYKCAVCGASFSSKGVTALQRKREKDDGVE